MATKKSGRGKSAARAKTTRTSGRKATVKKKAVAVGRVARRAAARLLDIAEKKIHRAAEQARAREKKSTKKATAASTRPAATTPRRTERRVTPQIRRVARTSTPVPDADVHTPSQVSFRGPLDQRTKADPNKLRGAEKILNEQFNEEDEYTNKSGDPRIGTHGRKYVP
jgi:hypothetical protein